MWTLTQQQKLLAPFSFIMVALLVAVSPLHAQSVTTTVGVGINPHAVVVNPTTNKIYVANQNYPNPSTVTVIDGATNATQTVNAGSSSNFLAVNPSTNKIYVSNSSSANVTVIDGATNATQTVAVGSSPEGAELRTVHKLDKCPRQGQSGSSPIPSNSDTAS
jgi:YVTN family beta-propeller protein